MKTYIIAIATLAVSITAQASGEFRLHNEDELPRHIQDQVFNEADIVQVSAPCPRIYLPVECEDEDGYLEEFTNECIAKNAGFSYNCSFVDESFR